MAKGDTFESEAKEYKGDRAEKPTLQLTDNGAHNRHLYLYAPTFADGGNTLIYISYRGGAQNLYAMDLATRQSRQITDGDGLWAGGAWYLEKTREIYYWQETAVKAVNIDTLVERTIYDEGYQGGYLTVSCDGRFVAFGADCDEAPGFSEEFRGHHALMVVSTQDSTRCPALVVPFRISHVVASPVDPQRLTFCWEGPWQSVPQRIWTSDLKGIDAGPLGCQNPNETRGHEFFTPSGTRVGYHGSRFHLRDDDDRYVVEETAHFVGLMAADGSDDMQFDCPGPTGHCQMSFAEDLFVCDVGGAMERDKQSVALIHFGEGKGSYEPLFYHGSSWKPQGAHPHPRFRPGDRDVVFTTDFSGHSNIYMTSLE